MPALLALLSLLGITLGVSGGNKSSSSSSSGKDTQPNSTTVAVADDGADEPDQSVDEQTDTGGNAQPDTGANEQTDTGADEQTDTGADEQTDTGDHGGHDMGGDEQTDTGGNAQPDTGANEQTDTGADEQTDTGDHGGHDMGGDEQTDTGADEQPDTGADEQPDTGDHGGHDMGGDEQTDTGADEQPDMGDHGGHDMGGQDGEPTIPVPAASASATEIAAYVEAVRAQPEAHMHGDDAGKMSEHMAAMELTPRDEATHIAVASGDWSDASTWHNGEVPGAGAKVLIPEGISVEYSTVSEASLFTVRVDGELEFATDLDSKMVFDTMVVSPSGNLVIGTEIDPVADDVTVELVVANNGPIDTDWDPLLLSRGLISHGETSMHGAVKDSHEKVIEDPMAGDTSIKFDGLPEGWDVGDKIVIAGTSYEGHKWDHGLQTTRHYESLDEVRIISSIEGDTVYFDEPLEHDHDTPREDLKTSVANYSRNISIGSEDGDESEVFERGHVMFMHSDEVDVRYVAFEDLGRTDKSETSMQPDDFAEAAFDNNVQGRYSLHLHRTGVDDMENPAVLQGNAVWGSPGWGIVHHDSNATLDNNATFDTFGAGFVAETGNETGSWSNNIAINAEGTGWGIVKVETQISEEIFDTARGGHGFWFQGRLIETTDNVAASVHGGFVYFHRDGDDRMIHIDSDHFAYSDAFFGDDDPQVGHASILDFTGNETFAAKDGLHIVKANPNQDHDVWSHLQDFTAWEVKTGAHLEYTSHYILEDFDLIAKEDTAYSTSNYGVVFGKSTSEMIVLDSSIDGFSTGVGFHKDWTFGEFTDEDHDFVVVGTDITNSGVMFEDYDPTLDLVIDHTDLANYEPDLVLNAMSVVAGKVEISGTKFDTLGEVDFPNGSDYFEMDNEDVVRLLETNGYYTTSDGEAYFLADIYFTDRITSEVFYETHAVSIDETLQGRLGEQWWQYSGAVDNGVQDIETHNGVTMAGDDILDSAIAAQRFAQTSDDAVAEMAHMAHSISAEVIWETLTENQPVLDEALPDDEMVEQNAADEMAFM